MRHEPWAHPFAARVGLHLGEVEEGISQVTQQVNLVSSAIDLASRTISLAVGGQILLTRLMYDAARPALREHPEVGTGCAAPGLRWMSHGHYQFMGAGEPVEIFEIGAEGVAPLCPPPDTEKARRCQSGAGLAGGRRAWWMIPLVAMVVLLGAGGWFWKQRNNPVVAVEREQIEHEVARLAADPPVAIQGHPAIIRMVDVVQPPDNAGFDVLEDHRVIDLRGWKEVPPEKVSELYSPVTTSWLRAIKKNAVTNRFEVELRTTGLDVFWNAGGAYPFTVEEQRGESFVGLQPVKVRKVSVDVAAVPVGHEFTLRDTSTYWNSIQTEEDQWFGVTGYEKCPAVTLLILFSSGRPFKSYRLSVTPTNRGKPVDFAGPRLVLADEKQTWIYWEIPDPVPGHVYRLQWQW